MSLKTELAPGQCFLENVDRTWRNCATRELGNTARCNLHVGYNVMFCVCQSAKRMPI